MTMKEIYSILEVKFPVSPSGPGFVSIKHPLMHCKGQIRRYNVTRKEEEKKTPTNQFPSAQTPDSYPDTQDSPVLFIKEFREKSSL